MLNTNYVNIKIQKIVFENDNLSIKQICMDQKTNFRVIYYFIFMYLPVINIYKSSKNKI